MESESIWLDGKLVPSEEAALPLSCAAVLNGAAVFEEARCYKGPKGSFVFRLNDHVKQFERSAKIAFAAPLPYSADKLARAALKTAKACELEEGFVRFAAYCDEAASLDGLGSESVHVRVAISCLRLPGGESRGERRCEMATAGVSSWRSISANALPPQAESASVRVNAVFAAREARRCGFDEPIVLTEAGDVCSGARKAIFAMRDGVLSTPPVACGVRESVERDTIINFAMDLEIPIVEERMARAELYIADELFLSDALFGIRPISAVDGCAIGSAGKAGPKVGPVAKALWERFGKMIDGKLDEYAAWAFSLE